MATAIRFRLVEPAVNAPLRSYYAVADLEIDGVCSCFGHAAVCIGEVSNNDKWTMMMMIMMTMLSKIQ